MEEEIKIIEKKVDDSFEYLTVEKGDHKYNITVCFSKSKWQVYILILQTNQIIMEGMFDDYETAKQQAMQFISNTTYHIKTHV